MDMYMLEEGSAVNDGTSDIPLVGSPQAGLTLDILIMLPRLSSSALRKIADECERSIRERMEDGVFD
jgi:hypothetical protein